MQKKHTRLVRDTYTAEDRACKPVSHVKLCRSVVNSTHIGLCTNFIVTIHADFYNQATRVAAPVIIISCSTGHFVICIYGSLLT